MLGLGDKGGGTNVEVGFRRGLLRNVSLALGGASGVAVILGGYELLQRQPERAFALLQSWGPAFLIALLAIFTLGTFLAGVNATLRESVTMIAESAKEGAQASARTADALTRLADQGSRQFEEVQRMSIYVSRELPHLYERLDRQDEMLEAVSDSLRRLHAKMPWEGLKNERGTGTDQA